MVPVILGGGIDGSGVGFEVVVVETTSLHSILRTPKYNACGP